MRIATTTVPLVVAEVATIFAIQARELRSYRYPNSFQRETRSPYCPLPSVRAGTSEYMARLYHSTILFGLPCSSPYSGDLEGQSSQKRNDTSSNRRRNPFCPGCRKQERHFDSSSVSRLLHAYKHPPTSQCTYNSDSLASLFDSAVIPRIYRRAHHSMRLACISGSYIIC